jgi:spoIIIJ-associated protein
MNKSVESQGKTVEEAVSEALLKLGARREEVRVTVLDEGKPAFLGLIGGRRARVRVERVPRGADRRSGSNRRQQGARQDGGEKRPRERRGGERRKAEAGSRGGGGRDMAQPDRSRRRPAGKPSRQRETAQPAPSATRNEESAARPAAAPVSGVAAGPSVRAAELVPPLRGVAGEDVPATLESLATDLLRRSGFTCRCEVKEGEYHLVKVVTDDSSAGILIGRRGATVDAVEHLVERMGSMAAGERVLMNLDINNYRLRREEALVERTQGLIDKVNSTGRDVHMEPLSARERRIVHLEVLKAEGLKSYTIATSSGKHVVIAREDQADEEAPPGAEENGRPRDDGPQADEGADA